MKQTPDGTARRVAAFDLAARQLGTLVAEARSWEAERVRAEKLAELDQAKTAFSFNISHELRAPLTLIMGPYEQLRAAPPPWDMGQEKDYFFGAGIRCWWMVRVWTIQRYMQELKKLTVIVFPAFTVALLGRSLDPAAPIT